MPFEFIELYRKKTYTLKSMC